MARRFVYLTRGAMVLLPLLALLPAGLIVADWVRVAQVAGTTVEAPARSFDGTLWQEREGLIVAAYVFPSSPASEAGLRTGDVFYMLEFQQYFNAEDVQRVMEGLPPGATVTYHVRRDNQFSAVTVRLTHYPTFLYPLSTGLWRFALWGFALGAFFHVLGLTITVPLAQRSRRAQFSLLLIAASALWVVSNLGRLLLMELLGPPPPGGTYAAAFEALTLAGLSGWIAFPALLLHKVAADTHAAIGVGRRGRAAVLRTLLYLPAAVLGGLALLIVLRGSVGPLTLDSLVAPILFYACCYVAASAGLVLAFYLTGLGARFEMPGAWNRLASAALFAGALVLALSVLGVTPLFGALTDTSAGWLIVSAQLLSVVPVALVAIGTLRYGKLSQVLVRAVVYLTTLGLIFFAFVGGMTFLERYVTHGSASHNVLGGLYVVLLLLAFERIARHGRTYAAYLFATDEQRARQALSRFQEQMRTILDYRTLAQRTVNVVGAAFDVRTARLFLRPEGRDTWIAGAYHPRPPYLTEPVLERVWPYLKREGRIWMRNPELNESSLPEGRSRLLEDYGAALSIPIMGSSGTPIGLLVLGPKESRRAVYNLADLDLLRSLSGQLALAAERLDLFARERTLIRESAEAELLALRAQINPHFLFNALNTIVALIGEQPARAERVVEHLAAIFRHILQAGSQAFVPMEEEFALVEHYLQIEQARFGERLTIEYDLPEALHAQPVPAFAVQTLVENAVKHGIGQRRRGGHVRVAACQAGPEQQAGPAVEVVVEDTGAGIEQLFGRGEVRAAQPFFGIGLRNVAARMERLYDRTDLLRLRSNPEGTTARLLLPVRTSETEAARAPAPALASEPPA